MIHGRIKEQINKTSDSSCKKAMHSRQLTGRQKVHPFPNQIGQKPYHKGPEAPLNYLYISRWGVGGGRGVNEVHILYPKISCHPKHPYFFLVYQKKLLNQNFCTSISKKMFQWCWVTSKTDFLLYQIMNHDSTFCPPLKVQLRSFQSKSFAKHCSR